MNFSHKDTQESEAPSEPPSYEQSQENHDLQQKQSYEDQPPDFAPYTNSQYGNLGPNEYPEEKKKSGYEKNGYEKNGYEQTGYEQTGYEHNGNESGSQSTSNGIPPGTYVVPPQKANIAYDTQGTATRPGYKEYLEHDKQRIAQGDVPKPRSFFGRKGAPLAPSKKGSGGGFPGAPGATYYNSSK